MADQIVRANHGFNEVLVALVAQYNSLRADLKSRGSIVHLDANVAADTTPVAVDLPTLITLANALKAKQNTHVGRTDAHVAADATNVSAAAAASDLATSITLVNDLKAKFNAHVAQAGVHINNDANTVATANGTVLGDTITLANAMQAAINAHMARAAVSQAIAFGAM